MKLHVLSLYWLACTYTTDHNCVHNEDVFLTCSGAAVSCPPGEFQNSRRCIRCPADSYKSSTDSQTSCTTCPGTTTSKPGSSYCSCNAGMFWNVTLSLCQDCAQGSVSPEGSLKCLVCPLGSKDIDNSTSCSCADGMVWKWTGPLQGSCEPCSPGTYKNSNLSSCTLCPSGTSSQVGSDHCTCPAGSFWNETICQGCPTGTVSQKGACQCVPCPVGSKTLGNTSCECPVGMTWLWDETDHGLCKPCLPGTYKSDQYCKVCPSASTSTSGSEHCLCMSGMFWNKTHCDACIEGSASPHGALECVICSLGTAPDKGATLCSCPFGKSWSWNNQGVGSCNIVSLSLTTGLYLFCSLGVLALISLTLGIVLFSQSLKLKAGKGMKNSSKVKYGADGNVEITGAESGLQCSGEDLIISQPGLELSCVMENTAESSFSGADDNIYNSLIKK